MLNKLKNKEYILKNKSTTIKKVTTYVSLLVFSIVLTSCGSKNEIRAKLGLSYNTCSGKHITPNNPVHGMKECIHCHKPCPIELNNFSK